MKKKTILSLLTGIAIVASTAGTYAVWDTTQATSKGTVTFRQPVTISATGFGDLTATSALNTLPTTTGTASFTVQNPGNLANQLTITPSIDKNSQSGVSLSDLAITITAPNGNQLTSSTAKDGTISFVDSNLINELTSATNNKLDYKITVTAANGSTVSQATMEKLEKSTALDFTGALSKSNATSTTSSTGQGASASSSQSTSSGSSGASSSGK